MSKLTPEQSYASSLIADLSTPEAHPVMRREVLLDWLREFLRRSGAKGYRPDPVDVENLIALDQYLRVNRLPLTPRAALET
jgi:hypothetical protein